MGVPALGFTCTRMENVSALPMLQRCHIVQTTFPARCICLTFGTGVSGRCADPTSLAETPLYPRRGYLLGESW